MKTTQAYIAQKMQVSESHLSGILSGKVEVGKRTAKKISKHTGVKWNVIIAMNCTQIRILLGL